MLVERGAGFEAKFRDDDYVQAGAKLVDSKAANEADIVLKVRQPHESEIPFLRENSTLISFLYPAQNKDLINQLAQKKINAFGETQSRIKNPRSVIVTFISFFFFSS